jgi:hypothetical protein
MNSKMILRSKVCRAKLKEVFASVCRYINSDRGIGSSHCSPNGIRHFVSIEKSQLIQHNLMQMRGLEKVALTGEAFEVTGDGR